MTVTTTRTEFQSSELSRNSAEVFAAAESHAVTVTRRNAEPLVLMSERDSRAHRTLFEFAATLIAVTTDDRGTLAERMSDRFPWMLALSQVDQAACAAELVAAARASFATEQPHLVAAALTSWKETAEAVAAGLGVQPMEWFDEDIPVGLPSA
ncbi:prevent-host-death protein [Leucobacter manosquensis]|uniref:Prevent-host-death protein n=1 Tax=Leucobacter manosquensis TaxID=2810611 RepID=A0ABS5M5W3_9MICO|nr:prevent-host-death protein [Leucobacter manosquensis]MBS3182403.1 prevent-host-death protein [Leucobacter manosquensis]